MAPRGDALLSKSARRTGRSLARRSALGARIVAGTAALGLFLGVSAHGLDAHRKALAQELGIGDQPLIIAVSTDEANYHGLYVYGDGRKGVFRGRTLPVGSFAANRFGLHDMHGNVREWVQDCYFVSYAGGPRDGRAKELAAGSEDECPVRVLRGGTWNDKPSLLRAAYRGRAQYDVRSGSAGFRVARSIAP